MPKIFIWETIQISVSIIHYYCSILWQNRNNSRNSAVFTQLKITQAWPYTVCQTIKQVTFWPLTSDNSSPFTPECLLDLIRSTWWVRQKMLKFHNVSSFKQFKCCVQAVFSMVKCFVVDFQQGWRKKHTEGKMYKLTATIFLSCNLSEVSISTGLCVRGTQLR